MLILRSSTKLVPDLSVLQMQNFFEQQDIELLEWPGNSPDLNPIENVWYNMKRRIQELKPQNKRELQEAVVRVWHHQVTADLCQDLILSMTRRCEAVIKSRGGPTKY